MEGKELPKLVYVSREKRPGYNHHKKAGAMNALVWSYNIFPFITIFTVFNELLLSFAFQTLIS